MSDEPDRFGGFVAVDRRTLESLIDAAGEARTHAGAVGGATAGLVELADDYRIDAVRRLRERGASEAQVERYERAFAVQVRAVQERLRALDAACEALLDRAGELL